MGTPAPVADLRGRPRRSRAARDARRRPAPGPDFFRYTDPAIATHDLTAAGFVDVSITMVFQTWELPTADDAVDALLHGTVRSAALLARQPAGVLDEVRRSAREQLAAYDEGGTLRIPMPAVVVRGTRP